MNDLIVLAASAGVVLFMVIVAAVLGFRVRISLDETEVARLAAAEGGALEGVLIAPNAREALARLSGGRIMVARAMADGVSARVAPLERARVRLTQKRVRVSFADIGFPPLNMRLQQAPSWLGALVESKP